MGRTAWYLIQTDLVDAGKGIGRCAECPCTNPVVPSDGPDNWAKVEARLGGRYFFIGEAPGREEDSKSIPFIGQAGQEFNYLYLPLAGLDRRWIYLTNTVKCRPNNNHKPSSKEIAACGGYFVARELDLIAPDLVVLMGTTACELVEDVEIDIETEHGMLLYGSLFGKEYFIFPTYHPALGLHDTNRIGALREDFQALGNIVRRARQEGSLWEAVQKVWCEQVERERQFVTQRDYVLLDNEQEARRILREVGMELDLETASLKTANPKTAIASHPVVALDTETVGGKLWSWQVGFGGGKVLMGWGQNAEHMGFLHGLLNTARRVIVHNVGHEVHALRKEGVKLDWAKLDDTMLYAYRLGLPQGLKALGRRLLGIRMKRYEDVVMGAWQERIWEWLCRGALRANALSEVIWKSEDQGNVAGRRKRKPPVLKLQKLWNQWVRAHGKMVEKDTRDTVEKVVEKCEKRWEKVMEELWQLAQEKEWITEWEVFQELCVPPPVPELDTVRLEDAVEYACMDADMTVRVWERMRGMEEEMGKG